MRDIVREFEGILEQCMYGKVIGVCVQTLSLLSHLDQEDNPSSKICNKLGELPTPLFEHDEYELCFYTRPGAV